MVDVIIPEVKCEQCLDFDGIVWNVVRLKSFSGGNCGRLLQTHVVP
jgi:hypothetical protein